MLRYGAFYGPDTGMLDHVMVEQIRHRRVPLIGDGGGWWSFVHVDDAAAATVRAVERGKPGSIYNIVDDEPAEVREWLPALAQMLDAKPPFHLPAWIARLVAGEHVVSMMTQVRAGSNIKARRDLGWEPVHPSWREGFPAITTRLSLSERRRERQASAAASFQASRRGGSPPLVHASMQSTIWL